MPSNCHIEGNTVEHSEGFGIPMNIPISFHFEGNTIVRGDEA